MKINKNQMINIILVVVLLAGLSLLLYPSFSNYWNSFRQSQVIRSYSENIADLSPEDYQKLWDDAREYNRELAEYDIGLFRSEEQKAEYEQLLNVSGNGVMGYIEIPKIDVKLPIHHGTSDSVLQTSVGHLEWSSLPVGGESSHCVLSGHRGLPSARLFTDLNELKIGDKFMLYVLDEVLTYQVDQIHTVEPQDVQDLKIVEGGDYCTLVTCTPYGVNTHRLLVRGHRVENERGKQAKVTSDAVRNNPFLVAAAVAIPLLLILSLYLLRPKKYRKTKDGGDSDEET